MARFHVSATYQTPSGNPGSWSGNVAASDHADAMAKVEARLRADKRRGAVRALDMSCTAAEREPRP